MARIIEKPKDPNSFDIVFTKGDHVEIALYTLRGKYFPSNGKLLLYLNRYINMQWVDSHKEQFTEDQLKMLEYIQYYANKYVLDYDWDKIKECAERIEIYNKSL